MHAAGRATQKQVGVPVICCPAQTDSKKSKGLVSLVCTSSIPSCDLKNARVPLYALSYSCIRITVFLYLCFLCSLFFIENLCLAVFRCFRRTFVVGCLLREESTNSGTYSTQGVSVVWGFYRGRVFGTLPPFLPKQESCRFPQHTRIGWVAIETIFPAAKHLELSLDFNTRSKIMATTASSNATHIRTTRTTGCL